MPRKVFKRYNANELQDTIGAGDVVQVGDEIDQKIYVFSKEEGRKFLIIPLDGKFHIEKIKLEQHLRRLLKAERYHYFRLLGFKFENVERVEVYWR